MGKAAPITPTANMAAQSASADFAERRKAAKSTSFSLSLRKNFSWALTGNLVSTGCRWGILVTMAKLGTAEMVGSYTLALGICTPIFTLSNINLRSVQTVDTQDEFDFSTYVSLRLISTVFAALTVILLAMVSYGDQEMIGLLLLVTILKAAESFSDVFHGLSQRMQRLDFTAKSIAANGALAASAVLITLHFTASLLYAVAAMALVGLLTLVLIDCPNALTILNTKQVGTEGHACEVTLRRLLSNAITQLRSRQTYRLAMLALPLGIGSFLCALNINIPRYFIALYIGNEELGYFSALAAGTISINLLVRSLGTSIMPTLARALDTQDQAKFFKYVAKMAFIAITVGMSATFVAWLWGDQLLSWVYRPEYAKYSALFVAIMVSGTLSAVATTLSLATTSARFFREQVLVYAINAIFLMATCWLLIPQYQLWGAVIALTLAAFIRISLYLSVMYLRIAKATNYSN